MRWGENDCSCPPPMEAAPAVRADDALLVERLVGGNRPNEPAARTQHAVRLGKGPAKCSVVEMLEHLGHHDRVE